MLTADYMHFVVEMERLERVLKAPEKYSRADYWELLRDLPLAAFRAQVTRCLQKSKFWPKPAELRGTGEASTPVQLSGEARQSTHAMLRELAQKDPQRNGHLSYGLDLNERHWKARLLEDPELGQLELRIAQYGLAIAREALDSVQYAEAVMADRRARDTMWELQRRRAGLRV